MLKKPWFGVNKFWGWYPLSWQAYIILVLMFMIIAGIMFYVNYNSHSVSDTLIKAFPLISLAVSATMYVTFLTGKEPEFGKENQNSKNYSPDNPKAYLFLAIFTLLIASLYVIFNNFIEALVLLFVFLIQLKLHNKLNLLNKK